MLTKHDIAEYYSDPAVRRRILEATHNKGVFVVQNRNGRKIYRKNSPVGGAVSIQRATGNSNDPNDLAWFTDRRYSEFHPTIGKKTDTVWVDVDPGPDVTTEDVKPIVTQVISELKKQPGVMNTNITFSGGRGFHVRGLLDRPVDTDIARKGLDSALKALSIPGTVFKKPREGEVRLDTSTLKNKGSLRAPYSINSDTGLIAVPLTERELRGFDPLQADVKTILKKKEFAPGIPRAKRMYALPIDGKDRVWTLAIQEHLARRAGKHWDLRLVDPDTGYAHSWAVPKAKLPEPGEASILAVRTPTHTSNYALNFGDKGPREISKGYGRGTVEIKHKEPVNITKMKDNSLRFSRNINGNDETFALFRTTGDDWLLKNMSTTKKEGSDMSSFDDGYRVALVKLGLASGVMPELSSSEKEERIQENNPKIPSDRLADLISGMENTLNQRNAVQQKDIRKPSGLSIIEQRLNRPTVFEQARAIPASYMEGSTQSIGDVYGGN